LYEGLIGVIGIAYWFMSCMRDVLMLLIVST